MDGTCGIRHPTREHAQRHVDELDEADRQKVNERRRALGANELAPAAKLHTGRAVILQTE
jgi:hypothetical protein